MGYYKIILFSFTYELVKLNCQMIKRSTQKGEHGNLLWETQKHMLRKKEY
jgi:hypothetical protein